MKYHDSLKKSQQIMALAIEQLAQWHLPVNPINYTVSYVYVSRNNNLLTSLIDNRINANKVPDNFFIDELYKAHILDQDTLRDGIVNDLDDSLKLLNKSCQESSAGTASFMQKLDEHFINSSVVDKKSLTTLAKQLKSLTVHLKTNQEQFMHQLVQSQEINRSLRVELKEVRKEIELDPVTGLYTRKTMAKHLEQWHQDDPNKMIAVIVIHINKLFDYNNKYGSLLSDVILSKVANKISSYVNKSGIPIRTGGDEFLILMPDISEAVAKEIAEKVNLGVEKLRFVSIQTGVKLPKMTLSLGITSKQPEEPIQTCINRARQQILVIKR